MTVTKTPVFRSSLLDQHPFDSAFGFKESPGTFDPNEPFLLSHAIVKWKTVEEVKELGI